MNDDRTAAYEPLPDGLRIGDAVLDGDGCPWRVLNRPDGEPPCDGLLRAMDGSGRQQYGEHVKRPVAVFPGG